MISVSSAAIFHVRTISSFIRFFTRLNNKCWQDDEMQSEAESVYPVLLGKSDDNARCRKQ